MGRGSSWAVVLRRSGGASWALMLDRVAASGWGGPGHRARGGLVKFPAACLLDLVVMSTQWTQVAQASPAALVKGHSVVEVGVATGSPAAGKGTRGLPGPDQMPQHRSGLVRRRLPRMVTVAAAQPRERESP